MATTTAALAASRIDWELLPSLRAALKTRWHRCEPVWQETVMSDFEPPCASAPFEEIVPGLAVREVSEPEIFRIFFDRPGGVRPALWS